MMTHEPSPRGSSSGLGRVNRASPVPNDSLDSIRIDAQRDAAPRSPQMDTAAAPSTSTLKRRNSAGTASSPPLPTASSSARLPSLHLDPSTASDPSTVSFFGRDTAQNGPPSLWSRLNRLLVASQPGFYDLQDPARRQQQGAHRRPRRRKPLTPATAHLPHRYQALMLSDDDDHLPTDIDDTDLLLLLSAERAQMTELTVSFFQSTWVLLLLLGLLASLTAWSVDAAVLLVTDLHDRVTKLGGAWLPNYLLYIAFRVLILLLGVTCTYFVCPNAAGSGIPEMRSILGGFPFPDYLRGRTLVAKSLGLVFALGSGLSIGKEGPFVHLSCVIAHQLLRLPLFRQIKLSQDLRHHVLSAACAVGVTATFGTPIGGVLFSIEVTTTYYVTSNYWRAFFASVVGVVVFRQLNSLTNVSLFTTQFAVLPYEPYEMVWFLLLAAICGVLAAVFVRLYRFIIEFKTDAMDKYVFSRCGAARKLEPFVYAACVALVFALVEYPVGSFMMLSQREVIDDMFSEGNLTATAADPTHLFLNYGAQWTSPALALNLLWYTIVRFFSTAISATVMVPSGIVTPVFAIGAVLGRLFGELVVVLGGGHELAGGYAVVGAASFTAGITGTVSIAVIVFELTSQLSYMVPVLLCVLVGRSVALLFSLDMYETIGRQKNLPQWPDLTKQKSYSLVASDLMRALPSHVLARRQTLASLQRLLHDAPPEVSLFPVVDDEDSKIYMGAVDREELQAIVEQWQVTQARDTTTTATTSTPRSREAAMSSQLALAGVTPLQSKAFAADDSQPVDLVKLELLALDAGNFHVHRDTYASQVILLISVHKSPQLFVTARGKLIGVIHAADLLARSRRFTL